MKNGIDLDAAGTIIGSLPLAKACRKGLQSAALRGVQEIITFIIPSRSPQPVDRGIYRSGWRALKTKDGAAIENLEPHAVFIEKGVQNVRIGPAARRALAEWAVHKGLATEKNKLSVAFAIGWAMKRRGHIFGANGLGIMQELIDRRLEWLISEEVGREVIAAVRRHIQRNGIA